MSRRRRGLGVSPLRIEHFAEWVFLRPMLAPPTARSCFVLFSVFFNIQILGIEDSYMCASLRQISLMFPFASVEVRPNCDWIQVLVVETPLCKFLWLGWFAFRPLPLPSFRSLPLPRCATWYERTNGGVVVFSPFWSTEMRGRGLSYTCRTDWISTPPDSSLSVNNAAYLVLRSSIHSIVVLLQEIMII